MTSFSLILAAFFLSPSASDGLNPAAHPASGADGYIIMNRPSDGNERAVLDNLMFL